MNKKIYLTKCVTFDAAHKLELYDGPCNNLHGHTYNLEVTISGQVDASGFVIDFKRMKQILEEEIISEYDHKYINDVLKIENPTAENMVLKMWEKLNSKIEDVFGENGVVLEKIRLYETSTSYVEKKREV